MDDRAEDMELEIRRASLIMDEKANVNVMKTGLKMVFHGIEMVNAKFNLLDLEGWSTEASATLMEQDGNLARIYRKYWRRGSASPERDLLFSILSSMGSHHMKRTMARKVVRGQDNFSWQRKGKGRHRPPSPSSSEDEGPPPV